MFGGQTDSNPFLGDLWTLDVAKGGWTEQEPLVVAGPAQSLRCEPRRRMANAGTSSAVTPLPVRTAETWSYDVVADVVVAG